MSQFNDLLAQAQAEMTQAQQKYLESMTGIQAKFSAAVSSAATAISEPPPPAETEPPREPKTTDEKLIVLTKSVMVIAERLAALEAQLTGMVQR